MNVSRETSERLRIYQSLLSKWNKKINLVAPNSLPDAWNRHFCDSLQLWDLAPKDVKTWVDMGSGAGFPGLVLAVSAQDKAPEMQFILVESDRRKAAFISAVARQTDTTITLINARIEVARLPMADIISARALAPLDRLLGYSAGLLKETGVCLFPKGQLCDREIMTAKQKWNFDVEKIPSKTDTLGSILRIKGICHV